MGAFDNPEVTVDLMMADPTFIPNQIKTQLDNAFLENLIFRQAEKNPGIVAFEEPGPITLDGEAEEIAEFAEIPVRDGETGEMRSVIAVKYGLGLRVSKEERDFNHLSKIQKRITQHMNTVLRYRYQGLRKAIEAAPVQTMAASSAWSEDSKILKDLLDAAVKIQEAGPEGDQEYTYDYVPDTVIMHSSTYTKLQQNKALTELFRGNIAHENPIFKGLKPVEIGEFLNVATDPRMPRNEVWVCESGRVGFASDTYPLTTDPFEYDRNSQFWRMNTWGKRALAVDNPKAFVKITGV